MAKKINVGVFPCGSEVGLEIHRSLKYYRHFHLCGLNSVDDNGRFAYKEYSGNLPFFRDNNFIPALTDIVRDKDIRFLIPGMDEVGYLLKKNEQKIGCEIVYPEIETANILRKKSTTYDKLKGIIKVPVVYNDSSNLKGKFPVFVKPDIGYGSRDAMKVETMKELMALSHKVDKIILMEYLPGKEYTIDCFSGNDGELLFSGARTRDRIRAGISVSSKTVNDQRSFENIAKKIGEALNLKGLWFFQLKEDVNNDLTLLEVAGRVSGSMALYRALGINFIASELFQRMGEEIQIPKLNAKNASLERSFDCKIQMNINFRTVYCDLDDCLIIDNQINYNLVAYLYECLNNGIKLILITRHTKYPIETLKKFRLTDLFDEIEHITDMHTSKASRITDYNSIFIDDSFAERNNVTKICGIPAFSPDVIDMIRRK